VGAGAWVGVGWQAESTIELMTRIASKIDQYFLLIGYFSSFRRISLRTQHYFKIIRFVL
jgi:hypothetical protein